MALTSYLIRRVLAKPRLILDEMCQKSSRLIFPRINGPIVYSLGLDFKPSNKLHDRLVEQVPTVHPNKMSCNCLYVQEEIATR